MNRLSGPMLRKRKGPHHGGPDPVASGGLVEALPASARELLLGRAARYASSPTLARRIPRRSRGRTSTRWYLHCPYWKSPLSDHLLSAVIAQSISRRGAPLTARGRARARGRGRRGGAPRPRATRWSTRASLRARAPRSRSVERRARRGTCPSSARQPATVPRPGGPPDARGRPPPRGVRARRERGRRA